MGDNQKLVHVNVTFRNTDATEPLRDYATDKVKGCVQKFAHKDTEVHVVLAVEKNRHIAEVNFHTDGADFFSKEESNDLYSSIDLMVSSLSQQLRKNKEKMTKHH